MNWLRHDFSLRSMKEGPGASRPRACILPPHPPQAVPLPLEGEGFWETLASTDSPLVIPTERSERRDLGTDLLVQEISPLGRFAPSVEMTRETLASTVA